MSSLIDLEKNLNKNLKSFNPFLDKLFDCFKNEHKHIEANKGISFLAVKNVLMIEYMTNLLNVVFLKTNGLRISDKQSIIRLAELRCITEKSKSIEFKLKYQIDKLLKLAFSSLNGESDPLRYRANANEFTKTNDKTEKDNEDVLGNEETGSSDSEKVTTYKPPRLAPVYNDIDQTAEDKTKREIERLKRRALNSSMIKEIENEYSGAPEEIIDNNANTFDVESNEYRHKIEYEEENFVRKPMTLKEKLRIKRLKHGTNLNSLTSFNDACWLLDENLNAEDFLVKKKEKKKNKSKKGIKKRLKKKRNIKYT